MGTRTSHGVGGGCKNVECKGILKDTNDDNTICSFVVVLFVLNGGTVYIYLSHCDADDGGDGGDDGVFDSPLLLTL